MESPSKVGGACTAHAPTPNQNRNWATITADARPAQACDPVPLVCGRCKHDIIRFQILPHGHVHFAQEVCAMCGCFVRWVPRLKTVERQQSNAFKLARLAMCPRLTHWERKFIASVTHRTRLSPKQSAIIDRLVRQHLEGETP